MAKTHHVRGASHDRLRGESDTRNRAWRWNSGKRLGDLRKIDEVGTYNPEAFEFLVDGAGAVPDLAVGRAEEFLRKLACSW